MRDTQDVTIALLIATAVILSAILLSAYRTQDPAACADTSVEHGDYLMVPGARGTTTDLLYVVDIAARRLNTYETNVNTWTMELIDSVDLERSFR